MIAAEAPEPTDGYRPRHRAAGWAEQPGVPLVVGMATAIVLIGVIAAVALATGGTSTSAASPSRTSPIGGAPISSASPSPSPSPAPSASVPTVPRPSPSTPFNPTASGSTRPAASPSPLRSPRPSTSPPADPTPSPSPPPTPGTLTARYRTGNAWDSGYIGTIQLTATGGAVSGWSLSITVPADATVLSVWGGQATTQGSTVTMSPQSWDETIQPGSPVTLGFQVNQQERPKRPLTCTVDGRPCEGL